MHVVYAWKHRTKRANSSIRTLLSISGNDASALRFSGDQPVCQKAYLEGWVEQGGKVPVLALLPNLQVGTEAKKLQATTHMCAYL